MVILSLSLNLFYYIKKSRSFQERFSTVCGFRFLLVITSDFGGFLTLDFSVIHGFSDVALFDSR